MQIKLMLVYAPYVQFTVFHEISKVLNLTYTTQEPQTGSKFVGVTTDLQARIADVGIAHLFKLYGRVVLMGLDHSNLLNMDHYSFLVLSMFCTV